MMDLTPLEVRKKKGDFRRQIRGYDPESVDDFLDLVADRFEALVRENAALTESSGALEQRVKEYREREKALTEALVSAQQLREEVRAKAVRDAEAALSQAERDAHDFRSLAAQEAERERREARQMLNQARADAAREIEAARSAATAEMERIRAELELIRERETAAIQTLQARRAELLGSYRSLLEGEMAGLEALSATVAGDVVLPEAVGAAEQVTAGAPETGVAEAEEPTAEAEAPRAALDADDALPPLSADLAALIEAAETDVELSWSGDAEGTEEPAPDLEEQIIAESRERDEALAEEPLSADAQDDDSWLSGLVEETRSEAAPAAAKAAWESVDTGSESDEDFIDSLIAEAGVSPTASQPAVEPPAFLAELDGLAEADEVAELVDLEPIGEAADFRVDEQGAADHAVMPIDAVAAGDFSDADASELHVESVEGLEPEERAFATDVEPLHVSADPLAGLDEDESFDALFDAGDEDTAEFDFDAALANATGFAGFPLESRNDADNAFDLGIELDDPGSPLDLGGPKTNGYAPPVRSAFSPARPSELTLRPLSPEEEAPDLPVESRPREETDDDMFTTMFHGR